jgi:hypothetical protein
LLGFTVSLLIQKSASKNCVAVDSEIGNENYVAVNSEIDIQTMPLSIQKLTAKNFPLPIQKSVAKNYATADSEINSDGGVISALLLSLFFSLFWCLHSPLLI